MPVALIQESYTFYETESQQLGEEDAYAILSEALRRHLLQDMVAGTILEEKTQWEPSEQAWKLNVTYECREMIARQDEGVYLQDYG